MALTHDYIITVENIHRPNTQAQVWCFDENALHGLICLNAWFQVSKTVWEELRGMASRDQNVRNNFRKRCKRNLLDWMSQYTTGVCVCARARAGTPVKIHVICRSWAPAGVNNSHY